MFDSLSQRLARIVKTMRGEARLTEANTQEMLREIRIALLEADVALPVVRDFIAQVKEKALGQEVLQSLTPGQALVGIVHNAMMDLIGGETAELDLAASTISIDCFIAVAAVADWRPAQEATQKIKKPAIQPPLVEPHTPISPADGHDASALAGTEDTPAAGVPSIPLVENPDILATIARRHDAPYCVGFAAETENLVQHATEKRLRKHLISLMGAAMQQILTLQKYPGVPGKRQVSALGDGGGPPQIIPAQVVKLPQKLGIIQRIHIRLF